MAVEHPSGEITRCLLEHARGEADAGDKLVRLVYDDLKRIARRQRWRRGSGLSLNTTGLVHEAYLKLVDRTRTSWNDRNHFFAVAARAMRQILVDQARLKLRAKRGGGSPHLPLEEQRIATEDPAEDLLAVHQALEKLEDLDPRLGRVVEYRFFAGLSGEETAEVLGVSVRTVERDWVRARGWLRETMSRTGGGGGDDVASP
jgi:RNA polymerase sigma factor (TIGR02999 family)